MSLIKVVQGDITTLAVDVIVNAANTTLLGGGGVDGAIHRVAGSELLEECKTLGGCKTGEAKITKGYHLPSKFVIHTPGPIWEGGLASEAILLENCYYNSLCLAEKYGCRTIAFPSISTGVYRFPIAKAAPIAMKTIKRFLETSSSVQEVQMVCFNADIRATYAAVLANLKA